MATKIRSSRDLYIDQDFKVNDHKITDLKDGVNPKDAVNVSQLSALLKANQAVIFKGVIGGISNADPQSVWSIADFNAFATYNAGWTWKVTEAGTIKGGVCEIGDEVLCVTTRAGSDNVDADFIITQANIDGAVTGPVSATDESIAIFDQTSGKRIKDSNKKIVTSLGSDDTTIPTSQAVKTEIDKKQNDITPGTIEQYYRGDKTMQPLDKSAVNLGNVDNTSDASKPVSTAQQTALGFKVDAIAGKSLVTDTEIAKIHAAGSDIQDLSNLVTKETTVNGHSLTGNITVSKADLTLGNVDNTSDASKPVSTAQQTALGLKEDGINKSVNIALGESDTLYPSQKAVKTYVDNQLSTPGIITNSTMAKMAGYSVKANIQDEFATPQDISIEQLRGLIGVTEDGLSVRRYDQSFQETPNGSLCDFTIALNSPTFLQGKQEVWRDGLKLTSGVNIPGFEKDYYLSGVNVPVGLKFVTTIHFVDAPQTASGGGYDDTVSIHYSEKVTGVENYPTSLAWYGVKWDESSNSTDGIRIASTGYLDLHASLPIQSQRRACLIKDDGTVNYYLDPNNWNKKEDGAASVLTGADGSVMVETPEHWKLVETANGFLYKKISEYQIDGWKHIKKYYRAAYKGSIVSGKLMSIKGIIATTGINIGNFRIAARTGRSPKFNITPYRNYQADLDLFEIEYATHDSQKEFTTELTAEGYKKGGLGRGCTDIANWDTFGYMPFNICGYSDSLGTGTGEVVLTHATLTPATKINRYRGVELPFGEIWEFVDGVLIDVTETNSNLYVCEDPALFADTPENYTLIGAKVRNAGWAKKMIPGEIIPTEIGGNDVTYYCDYHYADTGMGIRVVMFGATANAGSYAGLAYSGTDSSATYAAANIGSRLCFIP